MRAAGHRTGMMVAGTGLLVALVACSPVAGRPDPAAQVDALVARCNEAMAREVCTVQRDEAAVSRPPATAAPVFVAGTGAVDAKAYAEIREAGQAMCSLVKSRCDGDWQGQACKTARSLWPAPTPS